MWHTRVRRLTYGSPGIGLFALLLVALSGGAASPAHADSAILFASPTGDNSGCTQAAPCSLATALDQASDGDTIYLARGTYTGSSDAVVTLAKSLTLVGGWDGAASGPLVRDPAVHPTTIDAEGQRRGVLVGDGLAVTLDGLTMANGMAAGNGAGLFARNADLTLQATRFYSSTIDVIDDETIPFVYGGGAYVEGGTLSVSDSVFAANSAWAKSDANGGGLAISATVTATVERCLFQDNDAWSGGGLFYVGPGSDRAPLTVRGSRFVDNGSGNSSGRAMGGYAGAIEIGRAVATIEGNTFLGGRAANDYGAIAVFDSELVMARNTISGSACAGTSGLYLSGTSPFTLTNNVIAGNRSTYDWLDSPAVTVRASSGQFVHNTIADNTGTFGLALQFGSSVAMTNTVLVGHTVGITASVGCTATLEATLWGKDAEGSENAGDGSFDLGATNIYDTPRFVAPNRGDYHLAPNSAAIDAGIDAGVYDDVDGEARPQGNGFEIGADERLPIWHLCLPLVRES